MPLPHGCKWPHLGALFEVQWAPAGANAAPSADGGGLTVRSAWPCTRRLPFDPLDGVSYCTGTVGPGVCRGVAVPPPSAGRWGHLCQMPRMGGGVGESCGCRCIKFRIHWAPCVQCCGLGHFPMAGWHSPGSSRMLHRDQASVGRYRPCPPPPRPLVIPEHVPPNNFTGVRGGVSHQSGILRHPETENPGNSRKFTEIQKTPKSGKSRKPNGQKIHDFPDRLLYLELVLGCLRQPSSIFHDFRKITEIHEKSRKITEIFWSQITDG